MAGAALAAREPALHIVTAGTFSVDGQPISWRTREALQRVDLSARHHRSQQITPEHIDAADLVLAMAPEHTSSGSDGSTRTPLIAPPRSSAWSAICPPRARSPNV